MPLYSTDEIAESLVRPASVGIGRELLRQYLKDALLADVLGREMGELLAMETASEPEVVFARRPAGQRDFRDIRA